MSDYFLLWNGHEGKVLSQGVVFEFNEKPILGFDYENLLLETAANNAFLIQSGVQRALTDAEIAVIKIYCDSFADMQDYPVFAYDPNDNNLYKGQMQKSEAQEKNYLWSVTEEPANLTAAWDSTQKAWKVYRYAIRDDGVLLSDIAVLNCQRCVLFFTEEEWKGHSKPAKPSDLWDFVTETWRDTRSLADLKHTAELEIRNRFEAIRWKRMSYYAPQYEQDTWRVQMDEAKAWLADNTAPTPYLDAFLAARTDADVPTKAALVSDIIANNDAYILVMAQVNAQQWAWLKRLKGLTTNAEVDGLQEELAALPLE